MGRNLSEDEYRAAFKLNSRKALRHALDIRKFEIELYWKRATYFWTFIGATFVGYASVDKSGTSQPEELRIILSCLGLLLSFAWFCVNKGSKQWQENWENHVDMLEDEFLGPLYKTVLHRPKAKCTCRKVSEFLTGPAKLSVSKINQLISLFITLLWATLLFKALPKFSCQQPINFEYCAYVCVTIIFAILFWTIGGTSLGKHYPVANQRETVITKPTQEIEGE